MPSGDLARTPRDEWAERPNVRLILKTRKGGRVGSTARSLTLADARGELKSYFFESPDFWAVNCISPVETMNCGLCVFRTSSRESRFWKSGIPLDLRGHAKSFPNRRTLTNQQWRCRLSLRRGRFPSCRPRGAGRGICLLVRGPTLPSAETLRRGEGRSRFAKGVEVAQTEVLPSEAKRVGVRGGWKRYDSGG